MGLQEIFQDRAQDGYRVTLGGVKLPSAYRDGVKNTSIPYAMDHWSRPTAAIRAVFSEQLGRGTAYDRIDAKRTACRSGGTVAYLCFEHPNAKSGGMAAVARELPIRLAAKGMEVLRLAPLHKKITEHKGLDLAKLKRNGSCQVPLFKKGKVWKNVTVDVYAYTDPTTQQQWHLIDAEGYFTADGGDGKSDPYMYSEQKTIRQRDGADSLLLRDALFASKAVPYVLKLLKRTKDIIVHAQDWHFAATALTVKEALLDNTLQSAAVVLTCHNPFDHYLPREKLAEITRLFQDRYWPDIGDQKRDTVYSRMLPLLDGPVSTVSQVFASELTMDPLQVHHFAPHLQRIFEYIGLVGIENGLFVNDNNPYTNLAIAEARQGSFERINNEKLQNRHLMLSELEQYIQANPDKVMGHLDGGRGNPLRNLDDSIPIFLMSSRMDPGQKGCDALAKAIDGSGRDDARFIMIQMTGNDDDPTIQPYLQDLEDLALRQRGGLVVFKRNVGPLYMKLLAGATWTVWPSFYEPFGSVSESYIKGTPAIVRATGGLVQQIIDFEDDRVRATGLAYREQVAGISDIGSAWREIQGARRPRERDSVNLFNNMVHALGVHLAAGANIYRLRPELFGAMLLNVYDRAQELSWDKAASHCAELYSLARRPT